MTIIWTLFLIFNMGILQAQIAEKYLNGYDVLKDEISPEYTAGGFLIYDCKEKHWTCVNEEDFNECKARRDADLLIGKVDLSCAPVGHINNKKSCFQRQLYMVGQNHGSRNCLNDKWKEKYIYQK